MSGLSERTARLGPACRHWNGLAFFRGEGGCGIGHPIRKIVIAANGGNQVGIAFMLPCKPGPDAKAKCPNYDPRTAEELAEIEREIEQRTTAFLKNMHVFNDLRKEMVAEKASARTIDCPFCSAAGTMHVTCAIGINNHMWAKCSACREGFME